MDLHSQQISSFELRRVREITKELLQLENWDITYSGWDDQEEMFHWPKLESEEELAILSGVKDISAEKMVDGNAVKYEITWPIGRNKGGYYLSKR